MGCSSSSDLSQGVGVQGTCILSWQADLLNPFSSAKYNYIYAPGTSLAWDSYPNLLNSSFTYTSGRLLPFAAKLICTSQPGCQHCV